MENQKLIKQLTIEEAQNEIDGWIKTIGVRYFNELTNLGILMEEVGELSRLMVRKYGEQSFKQTDQGKEIEDELIVKRTLLAQLTEELTVERKLSEEIATTLTHDRAELKFLKKEFDNEELKANSLQQTSAFTDTATNLDKEYHQKKNTCRELQQEIDDINAGQNEETRSLLLSIKGNEEKRIAILEKLKPNLDDTTEELHGAEIVQKLESVLELKKNILISIANITAQIGEAVLQQNKIPDLEREVTKLELKLTTTKNVYLAILDRTNEEIKNIDAENEKIAISKQKEDRYLG